MPKEGYKKFGDPKFDQKQELPDLYYPSSEEYKDVNSEIKTLARFKTLYELKDFWGIEGNDLGAWQSMSFQLAEHCMPAMHFKKSKKRWSFWSHLILYALVEVMKTENPDVKRLEIFNLLPERAQNSPIARLIKPTTKPVTVESRYDKFVTTDDFKEFQKNFFHYSDQEKLEVCKKMIFPGKKYQ